MLRIRPTQASDPAPWTCVNEDEAATGFHEDNDYALALSESADAQLFIDDIEFQPDRAGHYRWRPSFYAGRVCVHVVEGGRPRQCWLDVSPSRSKSGDAHFAEMIEQIRAFDQTLLGGLSSATMAFGRDGRPGLYSDDVLLSRMRTYGTAFLEAVAALRTSPHSALSSDQRVLPLAKIRSFHPSTLQDRRLVALVTGGAAGHENFDSIQLQSRASLPTIDTPVNRTMFALLRRFRFTIEYLAKKVEALELGGSKEEQQPRVGRRLSILAQLADNLSRILRDWPFSHVSRAETSATGLAQIAAHPRYSRPYRLGSQAMMTGVEGDEAPDDLHVNHSWGIYETWCYVEALKAVEDVLSVRLLPTQPKAVAAQLAFGCALPDGRFLEVLFQAEFRAGAPSSAANRVGWSISRERRPDIVVVVHGDDARRALILDAKWRSGKENVLDAMQSAHIYHDSLRLGAVRISPCLLLLPAKSDFDSLEREDFQEAHGVGAVAEFSIAKTGCHRLRSILQVFLSGTDVASLYG